MEDKIKYKGHAEGPILELCTYLPDQTVMIEVGSYVGYSAAAFLKSGKIKSITCIDQWTGGYDPKDISSGSDFNEVERLFDILASTHPEITKLKMDSAIAHNEFENESVDFIYIDANHQYEFVKNDLINFLPKIKKGGIIGGHDYGQRMWDGVQKAVDEIVGVPDKTFSDKSWLKFLK